MFFHGWDAYEKNAFPSDELRPLTCDGLDRDTQDLSNLGRNDVLGNYSLTLVDSLDMFAILGDHDLFKHYVHLVEQKVSFDVPSTVQVFETTIRAMGGLLSAHLYASVPRLGNVIDGYEGHLLSLAYDLGNRLLPAFETPTGIPAPRVNLQTGYLNDSIGDITETCASGAGSLLLEFGLLSRLTGDDRFDYVARRAFFALYKNRSDLDMVAMSVDSQSGEWQSPLTGNGASIDSFYEYALKYSILFGDNDFMVVFNTLHHALKSHSFNGWTFRNIHYNRAYLMTSWIDSLASFYTSLMVLIGDLEGAIRNHLTYFKIWTTYAGLPERWSFLPQGNTASEETVTLEWYPLRPEFVESNYYLYQATKDPLFFQIGQTVMQDIQQYNKVPCGYAGIQNVKTGELSNRMESFFLSETVKYLYLLFNRTHPLNTEFSNFVFSTEAHPFWYDETILEHAGYEGIALDFSWDENLTDYVNTQEKSERTVLSFKPLKWLLRHFYTFQNIVVHFLHDLLSDSHMVQYMDESKLAKQVKWNHSRAAGPLNIPRFSYDDQCEVFQDLSQHKPLFAGLLSKIGSWDLFYQLDGLYDYTPPPYLPPNRKIEFTPFYDRYIDPSATCRALSEPNKQQDEEKLDLLVSIPNGGRRGTVLWRHGGGEVEATSIHGMRLKLKKTDDYQVTMVNGIEIQGMLWVREMNILQKSSASAIDVIEGRVYLNGIPIKNIEVIGK